MGKRRNTAKTGDKAVSGKGKKQTLERKNARDDDDDDPMYTKVDRYHNQKEEEFMKLDYVQSDSEEEEEKEAVMDLGLGGDDDTDGSSDEPSDDDDSDLQDGEKEESDLSSDDDAEVSVSSSDEEEEEEEMQDVRNWGRNKKAYYHGDTADLEIGQEIDDAYLEEEAAKEVQRARYEEMSDDDFELSDSEEQNEEKKQSGDIEKLSSSRDVNKLPTKERKKLLDKQHPEILPLISYFSGALKEFDEKTNPAAKALFEGEKDAADAVGATTAGKRYLLAKAMLQASSALNLTMYLLLKKEDQNSDQLDAESSLIQSHPVMARLQRLNSLSDKLEEYVENKVPGLSKQLANIAEAAKLVDANSEKEDSAESDDESVDQIITSDNEAELDTTKTADLIETASSDEDDQSVSTHESAKEERRVQTEARFGLRHSEISQSKVGHHRKRRAVDFGEIEAVDEGIQKAARQSLAATLNTIEQKTSRKNTSQLPDIIDETQEPDDALRRGLEMMEEQLGKDFDKNSDDASHQASFDPERDSDDEMGFYEQVAKKSKIAKAERKARYAVAPKFPRMDSVVEGERAISSHILKNRGLVAHKAKINRNPRVKKRVQYKKALVRRKGAVREVRQDEGHKYGGESTGIKTKVSRSRKLA